MQRARERERARVFLFLSASLYLLATADRIPRSHANAHSIVPLQAYAESVYNVKTLGAKGDGQTLDTTSINKAIDAAVAAGGGTVFFPAGNYLSVSIHLKSNITLYLDQGATIVAADPKGGFKYDAPEPNPWDKYQDFGHSHCRNSLIWGENLENISIIGPGRIWGKGLVSSGAESGTEVENEAARKIKSDPKEAPFGYPNPRDAVESGWANKAISLKSSRNVIIRDITILHGGHFAVLATGVDNLTIDNVKIDTNRDGIDIDACRNVRISNCTVNSPRDDGICLKSSYALGVARATENVTITNCQVSGYDEGTLFDGTYKREYNMSSQSSKTAGRIKLGTESNGGFKNITISNCLFDFSCGLALEIVDGGLLEDVVISNITMRDTITSPIFIRLGNRGRGPKESASVGAIHRVLINNLSAYNSNPKYASIISGIPGHASEDLKLSNLSIHYQGGGTKQQAVIEPPENEAKYPDTWMFGDIPAYGFFIRHVKGIEMDNISVSFAKEDARPAFVLNDVRDADFFRIRAEHAAQVPTLVLKAVEDFSVQQSWPLADVRLKAVKQRKF